MAVGVKRLRTEEEFLSVCPELSSDMPPLDPTAVRIFALRHFESKSNKKRRYTGRKDSPLSEEGKIQGKKLNSFLKKLGLRFDGAITSPLSRTQLSVELAAEGLFNPGATKKTTKKLYERYLDIFENISLFDPDYLKFRKTEAEFFADPSKSFEELMEFNPLPETKIENFKEVGDRAFKAFEKLEKGKTYIAGIHSQEFRAILARILKTTNECFIDHANYRPENGSIIAFDLYKDGRIKLLGALGLQFTPPKDPSAH